MVTAWRPPSTRSVVPPPIEARPPPCPACSRMTTARRRPSIIRSTSRNVESIAAKCMQHGVLSQTAALPPCQVMVFDRERANPLPGGLEDGVAQRRNHGGERRLAQAG